MQLLFQLIFFISRLVLLNWNNVFFDSKEYLTRLADNNFLHALTTGHPPLHSGFILTFWPFYKLWELFGINPAAMTLVMQTILAWLTIRYFYKLVELLINKEVAWRSAVLLSVVPIFWIINEAIMMETTYLFYWITSLYFLCKYLKDKRDNKVYILASSLLWVMAFLTHTVVIMWIPLFVFVAFTTNKDRTIKLLPWALGVLATASVVNAYLLSKTYSTNFLGGLYWLYAAKFGEHAAFQPTVETLLRYGRNWLLPIGYNNTWVLSILAILGLIKLFRREKRMFWMAVLWIAPTFITNQWWDSLMYGRHGLIATFALVFLVTNLINKVSFKILVGIMLIISLSSLSLMKKPTPYLEIAKAANRLQGGGLFIDSHFARPQTDGEYFGRMVFVDEPGWIADKLPDLIDEYLKINKPVYITGQALSEPYGLFSGPFLHPLSLSYKNGLILSYLKDKYRFSEVESVDDIYNLNVFQISKGTGGFPQINNLSESRRRIDWLDPFRIMSVDLLRH